jgi:hypothetical protein
MKKLLLVCLLCLIPYLSFASGPQVLATGTCSNANHTIVLTDGAATMACAGTDFTGYAGEWIEWYDATKRVIKGYIGALDGADTKIYTSSALSTQNWQYKNGSFDNNDAGNYSWRILSTNIPGKQIASGTVSATDVKLATVDGGAMVEITGVDLSPYAGDDAGGPVTIINPKSTSAATMTTNKYLLALYDSSGRVATGYVGAAGGGETLGAEIATGTLTAGKLYKITATEANHFYTGCAIGEYFTSVGTETCDANNKVQEVTEIAATGVHGHSTVNATDRKMKLNTCNPDAITSYKIYRTY